MTQTEIDILVIARIKLHGITDPILSKEIEQDFNIDGNKIRDIVREARRKGIMIASTGGSRRGYFLAKSRMELQPTIDDIRGRGNSLFATAAAMEKSFEGLQEGLF